MLKDPTSILSLGRAHKDNYHKVQSRIYRPDKHVRQEVDSLVMVHHCPLNE